MRSFDWDTAKNNACLKERGFDFEFVTQAFRDPHHQIRPDARRAYGEDRFRLLGKIGTRVFFVVFTLRDPHIRLISARKANKREVREYQNENRSIQA
jgi:uncharacterized protein